MNAAPKPATWITPIALLACFFVTAPANAANFKAVEYARRSIYHSPQTPGFTSWAGAWTMPDGSEVEQSHYIDPNSWKWFADLRVPAIMTGHYQLRITNIVADGYSFAAESSAILSVGITVLP